MPSFENHESINNTLFNYQFQEFPQNHQNFSEKKKSFDSKSKSMTSAVDKFGRNSKLYATLNTVIFLINKNLDI